MWWTPLVPFVRRRVHRSVQRASHRKEGRWQGAQGPWQPLRANPVENPKVVGKKANLSPQLRHSSMTGWQLNWFELSQPLKESWPVCCLNSEHLYCQLRDVKWHFLDLVWQINALVAWQILRGERREREGNEAVKRWIGGAHSCIKKGQAAVLQGFEIQRWIRAYRAKCSSKMLRKMLRKWKASPRFKKTAGSVLVYHYHMLGWGL